MFGKLKSMFSTNASDSPDECISHKKQGDGHLGLDQLHGAVRCYKRALSINPDYVDACVALGYALSEQKEYVEAAQYLQHALSLDPGIADAHYILGTISRNQNDPNAAMDHYTRALDIKPDFEFAYRDLLAVLFQIGQISRAKDVLGKATGAYPDSAEFQFYLGNVFIHEADYASAADCYRKAASLQPKSAESHKSLADALMNLGHIDEAVACYGRAVAIRPEWVDVQIGLGNGLERLGMIDAAIECYRRAAALEPGLVATHEYLGNSLLKRGATKEAVACYERVLELEPESPVKHLIASLSGGSSDRAPSAYVERLFDGYADRFDSHLVGTLNYTVPERMAGLLQPFFDPDTEKWNILDLGCGTGLSGLAIAPFARTLVGVDLSAKMLEKARERHLYHRLEHLDLLTMMQGESASSYDVVLAADVFVYLGKLDELVSEARRVLRAGGLFAFSVESLDALLGEAPSIPHPPDYQLNNTGRYAHSIAYLSRMAADNGFDVLAATKAQTRMDMGTPVQGYLVLWRRPVI